MNANIIKKEISVIIETVKQQSKTILNYTNKIPQIELDLIMENIRKLYEKLYELNKINYLYNISSEKEETKKVTQTTDKTIREIKPDIQKHIIENEKQEKEEYAENKGLEMKTNKEKIIENIIAEKQIDFEEKGGKGRNINIQESSADEKEYTHKPAYNEIPLKEKNTEYKNSTINLFTGTEYSIADKFKDDKKSINEKIFEDKKDGSVSAKIRNNKIENLKSAIGINDKFLFINELFYGNMNDYNEAIDKLNNFNAYQQASDFIDILKESKQWDKNSEAYKILDDFVKRRYF